MTDDEIDRGIAQALEPLASIPADWELGTSPMALWEILANSAKIPRFLKGDPAAFLALWRALSDAGWKVEFATRHGVTVCELVNDHGNGDDMFFSERPDPPEALRMAAARALGVVKEYTSPAAERLNLGELEA